MLVTRKQRSPSNKFVCVKLNIRNGRMQYGSCITPFLPYLATGKWYWRTEKHNKNIWSMTRGSLPLACKVSQLRCISSAHENIGAICSQPSKNLRLVRRFCCPSHPHQQSNSNLNNQATGTKLQCTSG